LPAASDPARPPVAAALKPCPISSSLERSATRLPLCDQAQRRRWDSERRGRWRRATRGSDERASHGGGLLPECRT
jgi:hypothetical protein